MSENKPQTADDVVEKISMIQLDYAAKIEQTNGEYHGLRPEESAVALIDAYARQYAEAQNKTIRSLMKTQSDYYRNEVDDLKAENDKLKRTINHFCNTCTKYEKQIARASQALGEDL